MKFVPRTLKKNHFSLFFFKFLLRFAKLLKYISTNEDLVEIKVDQNDLADMHVLSNLRTFESNGR